LIRRNIVNTNNNTVLLDIDFSPIGYSRMAREAVMVQARGSAGNLALLTVNAHICHDVDFEPGAIDFGSHRIGTKLLCKAQLVSHSSIRIGKIAIVKPSWLDTYWTHTGNVLCMEVNDHYGAGPLEGIAEAVDPENHRHTSLNIRGRLVGGINANPVEIYFPVGCQLPYTYHVKLTGILPAGAIVQSSASNVHPKLIRGERNESIVDATYSPHGKATIGSGEIIILTRLKTPLLRIPFHYLHLQ